MSYYQINFNDEQLKRLLFSEVLKLLEELVERTDNLYIYSNIW